VRIWRSGTRRTPGRLERFAGSDFAAFNERRKIVEERSLLDGVHQSPVAAQQFLQQSAAVAYDVVA